MKIMLQFALFLLSRAILHKYKPDIIGITGSVGKTSAKEAMYFLLKRHLSVRQSEKNFNTAIGVPLAIMGIAKNPSHSLVAWITCLVKGLRLVCVHDRTFPFILLLEMGADGIGDISYLTKLAPCKVGVLTAIGPAHLEKFGTMERLVNEKKEIIRHLKGKQCLAVVNADDPFLYPLNEPLHCRVMTYGLGRNADVCMSDIKERFVFRPDDDIHFSLSGDIVYGNESEEFELARTIGAHLLYPPLAAICVALYYGTPLKQIARDLREYCPQRGRMRLIHGIKYSLIIDDTYNSSPLACRRALDSLAKIEISPFARRIAVLGDMLELGNHTERLHRDVGAYLTTLNIDRLITVGSAAQWIADGASDNGIDMARILRFDTSQEAAAFMRNDIGKGDVVLAKASQGIRLERFVKELMADPQKASQELVRQDAEWL